MDVIIIGSGAAGLMAGKLLSAAGCKVTILEGRDRAGGRVHSFSIGGYDELFEGGAEFIHGQLPETLALLKEAGMTAEPLQGKLLRYLKNTWVEDGEYFSGMPKVMAAMKDIKEDCTIESFLKKYFGGSEYEYIRQSLTAYIEGYYSGTIENTSTMSFLQEVSTEEEQQFRPGQGYGKLIAFLEHVNKQQGAVIHYNTVVKRVDYSENGVVVTTNHGIHYRSSKVLVTVPIGVLRAPAEEASSIVFSPEPQQKMEAIRSLGFGSVIKILIYFDAPFWHNHTIGKHIGSLQDLHMAITDLAIPTWWTQHPNNSALLTGWIAGPAASGLANLPDVLIADRAFASLSSLFHVTAVQLKKRALWFRVFNWNKDPFTKGSYSYSTLQSATAIGIMQQPEKNVLFFAGEGVYKGTEIGTVEAAITSARDAVDRMLK